jgi:hypothetical protein
VRAEKTLRTLLELTLLFVESEIHEGVLVDLMETG